MSFDFSELPLSLLELTLVVFSTSLSLYGMLAGPLGTIPAQMTVWAQSKLAIDRLDQFFAEGERPFHPRSECLK